MFMHRLVLFLALVLGTGVLFVNACTVVNGGVWIFRAGVQ